MSHFSLWFDRRSLTPEPAPLARVFCASRYRIARFMFGPPWPESASGVVLCASRFDGHITSVGLMPDCAPRRWLPAFRSLSTTWFSMECMCAPLPPSAIFFALRCPADGFVTGRPGRRFQVPVESSRSESTPTHTQHACYMPPAHTFQVFCAPPPHAEAPPSRQVQVGSPLPTALHRQPNPPATLLLSPEDLFY